MNPLVIVLGVILVVVILMSVFSQFFSGESTLTQKVNLAEGVPQSEAKTLSSPGATNRTYSVWIYVNTWVSGINKMILGRTNDIVLYLDKDSAKLKCKIGPDAAAIIEANAGTTSAVTNLIDITNNFPIQKWCFVAVVVDSNGNICDFYLDGKLVKSVKLDTLPTVVSANPIVYGKGHDTFISDVKRLGKVSGPQDIWNAYSKGNSGSSLKSAVGDYNVNLSILKDNVATSSYSLI